MSLDNSLTVACGDAVVVATAWNPYYKGRNESLLSIGQKGRFLLVGKCRK